MQNIIIKKKLKFKVAEVFDITIDNPFNGIFYFETLDKFCKFKDMKIKPFSNASEFELWKCHNCYGCEKYESESYERSKAGCILAFDLDLASVSDGEISTRTANKIGYNKELNLICNQKIKC